MAYQNVGRPKFYIDHLSKLLASGTVHGDEGDFAGNQIQYKFYNYPGLVGLTPTTTHTITEDTDNISFDIPTKFATDTPINNADTGRVAYVAALGHTLKSSEAKINVEWHDGNGNRTYPFESGVVNHPGQDEGNYPEGDGFSIFTFTDEPSNADKSKYLRINLGHELPDGAESWSTSINALSWGFVYEMPHSPELSVKMTREMDGITRIRTLGGSDLIENKYSKPPKWNTLAPWEIYKIQYEEIYHPESWGPSIYAYPPMLFIPGEAGNTAADTPDGTSGYGGQYWYVVASQSFYLNNWTANDGGPGQDGVEYGAYPLTYEFLNGMQIIEWAPVFEVLGGEILTKTNMWDANANLARWGGYNPSGRPTILTTDGGEDLTPGGQLYGMDWEGVVEGKQYIVKVNSEGQPSFYSDFFHAPGASIEETLGEYFPGYYTYEALPPPSQATSRSGRRIWELEFNYLSDSDIFPDISSQFNYEVEGSNPLYPTENTLITEYTFISQVLEGTNGGQLPFIFQPDGSNNNPDQFAIAKFDMDSFEFTQVANGVYNVKLKIREVW